MVSLITALILQLGVLFNNGQKPADNTKPAETKPSPTLTIQGGTGQWVGE
ncbi:hypothetical protein GCM10027443_05690 [Pontibacter brevis]